MRLLKTWSNSGEEKRENGVEDEPDDKGNKTRRSRAQAIQTDRKTAGET